MARTPNLSKALEDIRSVKVQGAERIALFFLEFLSQFVFSNRNDKQLGHLVSSVISKFIALRSTEPCLRNASKFVMLGLHKQHPDPSHLLSKISEAKLFLEQSGDVLAHLGSQKIKQHMIVYTHCHSSSVIRILSSAHKNNIKFLVKNTETRPLYQGRKTATELAKHGIPVEHYIDSAMRLAIKRADIVLLGADAITDEKIYNKIGSELVCELAKSFDIPVYICSTSWKYDAVSKYGLEEKIEERSSKEIWTNVPKGITVKNFAFEKINPLLITGIISELGILPVSQFLSVVVEKYPWMVFPRDM